MIWDWGSLGSVASPVGAVPVIFGKQAAKMEGAPSVHGLGYRDKSALASHNLDPGHPILFSDTTVLFRSSLWWDSLVRKSLEIQLERKA